MLSDLCRQIFFSHIRYLPTYLSLLSLKSHLHFCLFLSLKQLRVAICKIEVEISFKPCNYRFLSIDETFISVRLTSQSYGLNSLVFQENVPRKTKHRIVSIVLDPEPAGPDLGQVRIFRLNIYREGHGCKISNCKYCTVSVQTSTRYLHRKSVLSK